MRYLLLLTLSIHVLNVYSQQTGTYVKDKKTGCRAWTDSPSGDDSISWSGACKNKMADGYGTLNWYQHGQRYFTYTGQMREGRCNGQGKLMYEDGHIAEGNFANRELHGQGTYILGPGRQLKGNFVHGKYLQLDSNILHQLHRHVIPIRDSTNIYVGDGASQELFYYALAPQAPRATIVLFPGTWESPENVLSSNSKLVQLAYANQIAILVPSLNQRLTLNSTLLGFINSVFSDAIKQYNLPANTFVLGGFSMGGLMSLRYTEMAYEGTYKTVVTPKAVFSVDGPADLETLYRNFQIKAVGSHPQSEAHYGLREFEQHIGGSPDSLHQLYVHYSSYSHLEKNGGNARFLQHVPVRIYTDADVNWWIDNRMVDAYDMNVLDQSAMIILLKKLGNTRAELINAFGKGYRLEGNRHPHSWSIVDADECMRWVLECIR